MGRNDPCWTKKHLKMKTYNKTNFQFLLLNALTLGSLLSITELAYKFFFQHSHLENIALTLAQIISFNFAFAAGITMLLTLPFVLMSMVSSRVSKIFLVLTGIIILLSTIGLNQYATQTNLPLGSDLYGYSFDDILFITGSSAEFSLSAILMFILIPTIYLTLAFLKIYQNKVISIISAVILITAIVSLPLLLTDLADASKTAYFLNDTRQYLKDNQKGDDQEFLANGDEFPLMHPFNAAANGLTEHLNLTENKPNIVLLVVEGLGSDFMGKGAQYPGFTPFLDSLSDHSLYFSRFLSNTGRSFGALPSILGSAPFGKNGFLDLETLPDHMSLISVLKQNGYVTSYYEGGNSSFDNKNRYLVNEGIDNLTDENSFDQTYVKTESTKDGFSWGYPDSEIYRKTLASLPEKGQPRLDIVLSISNHEPFQFPGKEEYLNQVNQLIKSRPQLAGKRKNIEENPEVFASLLYTDASIRSFIDGLTKRSDFENTIVLITGDHRLIPISMKNQICRYHVPLLVYSPLVKEPKEIRTIASHMDIAPAITGMLANGYPMKTPENVPWLGLGLSPNNEREIPLMKYKGSFTDFIKGDTFIAQGKSYKIGKNLSLSGGVEKAETSQTHEAFELAKKSGRYTTTNNKIIPENLKMNISNLIKISKEDQKRIDELTKNLSQGEIYYMARDSAHNKNYEIALLLLDHLNNLNFNHYDGRTLRGRIYGWSDRTEQAEQELKYVINRSPLYSDAYSALLDLYWWNSLGNKAKEVATLARERFANNRDFLNTVASKMARFDPADFEEKVLPVSDQLSYNQTTP